MNFLFSSKSNNEASSTPSSTTLSNSQSSASSSAEDWQRRIYSLQSERCTPAMRRQYQEQMQAKEARKKRIDTSCKSARRLETTNYLQQASNVCTLSTFSAPAMSRRQERHEREEVYATATPKTLSRASKLQESAQRRAVETSSNDEEEDSDLNEITDELTTELKSMEATISPQIMSTIAHYGIMSSSQRAAAATVMNTELEILLKQLEVEPTEDSELVAKFALFETFLQTVTVIREQTLQFWHENMDLFEGGSKLAAKKEVDKIDTADSMGILDDPRKWFVYAMTKKANENSVNIGHTLSLLRSRLEQMSSTEVGDCPFCLEDMGPLKEAQQTTVLTCCHRVCTPCWEQWKIVKGAHAFCPLCRNDEFVEEVLSSPIARGGV